MADWTIKSDGVDDFGSFTEIPSGIVGTTWEWEHEFKIFAPSGGTVSIMGRTQNFASAMTYSYNASTPSEDFVYRLDAVDRSFTWNRTPVFPDGGFHVLRLLSDSGVLRAFIDGVEAGNNQSGFFTFKAFNCLFRRNGFYGEIQHKRARLWGVADRSAAPLIDWNANSTSSNGSGFTLYDDATGTYNATLNNFPGDQSFWINVEAATGPSASVAVTAKKPTAQATGSSTLPQPSASVAVTAKKPTAQATGSSTLPQPSASVAVTAKKPTVLVSGTATSSQASAAITLTAKKPTVQATGSATLPQPSANLTVTAKKPTVQATGSATLPQPSAQVAATVKKPTVQATGAATLPQPSAAMAVTAKKPTVNVVAIAGEVVIISADGNTIQQPTLSNVVSQAVLSNLITR